MVAPLVPGDAVENAAAVKGAPHGEVEVEEFTLWRACMAERTTLACVCLCKSAATTACGCEGSGVAGGGGCLVVSG